MLHRLLFPAMMAIGLLMANATAADRNGNQTRKLIDLLQSNAPFFDKARACQQLGEFGGREAVPALAALLPDEHLSAYARSGLEGIPDPSAAAALRAATGRLKGNQLAGAVNSLGVLRDPQAVDILRQLAGDPASGVAAEALLALGRIATKDSIPVLRDALANGSEILRTNAASACLLAAERQLAEGHADTAIMLYDAVRQAQVPPVYRAGATRGAIVARKANGIPLLIEQLKSNDRLQRNAALITIREIPGNALADALAAELDRAPAELQVQLLTALVDCHNAQSLPAVQAKTTSAEPEVRKTALTVLGRIGGPAEAGVLLKAVTDPRSAEESVIALNSLGRLAGAAIDEQIVKALAAAADTRARIALIRLAEGRGMTNAAGELLKQAGDADAQVGVAALRALKTLAGPAELSALIALAKASRDEAVREAAENAVIGAGANSGKATAGNAAVWTELKQATDPILKNSWIRILVAWGYHPALPTILAALNDANESVAMNAMEQLARWPDPAPIDGLFAVVQSGANPVRRKRALASIIQLATMAAEERQRPDETVIQWLGQAGQAAQTVEERRSIISGLGRLPHLESFRLLTPYLDQPGLQNEAAVAVLRIAPALRGADPAAVKAALEKIAAKMDSPDLRRQAAKLAASMPSQVGPVSLFDGRLLTGWEGDTQVWRVRDGVIVGGSLQGNPRNEFLATVRRYTNFILRLEYKLVGTEGFVNSGVQFRSVRVKQPPNEMSGFQADIGAGYSGCLYDESRRNKFLARPAEEQVKRLEKPGDWNRYEVRCDGPRIRLALNGEQTVDYTETDATLPREGLIGLQIHGNNKAEVSFRNLTIEETP